MDNVATYSEARSEYTKQLATFIVPTLVAWFQQLWHRNASDKQRCLVLFQNDCEEVARWNQDRIHDEVRVLIERTGCDYMEDLMTAVFIAHTKVLTAVGINNSRKKKLSISVPKLDHFIHRVFREAARSYWKTPFLFMESGSVVERQKNILQIEALANEAIATAVRGLLPVKQILSDYLDGEQEEIDDDEMVPAAVTEPIPLAASEMPSTLASPELPAAPVSTPALAEAPMAEPASSPVPAPAEVPKLTVIDVSAAPANLTINTEPAVHFSDYDAVFDDTKGAPELRYTPKAGEDEYGEYDGPADGYIQIDNTAKEISFDEVEDLDAPVRPPANQKEVGDLPMDNDFEVLE